VLLIDVTFNAFAVGWYRAPYQGSDAVTELSPALSSMRQQH
jgi:hypothetical protein